MLYVPGVQGTYRVCLASRYPQSYHSGPEAFDQDISVPKTKILDICTSVTASSISESDHPLLQVHIGGQVVTSESAFRYLGSFESIRGETGKEVSRVIQSMPLRD